MQKKKEKKIELGTIIVLFGCLRVEFGKKTITIFEINTFEFCKIHAKFHNKPKEDQNCLI